MPATCPGCGRDNIRGAGVKDGWVDYIMQPAAPMVGCGGCGHVVLLKRGWKYSQREGQTLYVAVEERGLPAQEFFRRLRGQDEHTEEDRGPV